MKNDQKVYKAIIWTDKGKAGERVSICADSLIDARKLLEDKYGKDTVFDLHNEDDARKKR